MKSKLIKELETTQKELNADANSRWEDEKIFQIGIEERNITDNEIKISLWVGKFEGEGYTISFNKRGEWKIIHSSRRGISNIAEDIITYAISPSIYKYYGV